jgi:TonB family protein
MGAEEGTVLMSAPGPAAEGTVLMSMPPPTAPGAAEGTVLMSAPGLAAPAAEGTVLMSKSAPLPITGPLARPTARQIADPSQKRGGSWLLLVGGGALVLGVGVVAGLVYFLRQPTAVPTPSISPGPSTMATPTPVQTPTAPPVSAGSLRVESTPPGANLIVDGTAKGTTPADVTDLVLGPHEIKLEMKGYQGAAQTVELTPEVPQASVSLTLDRTAPVTGSLEVGSVPSGAAVALNGASAGQTPYRNRALRLGTYRVQVTREGYEPWVGDATVQAGKRVKLDAQLKALPKATPTPEPRDVVEPNKVYAAADVDVKPKRVSGATASYPSDAPRMKSGEQVSVSVTFTVTESGDVTDVKVVESGGKQVDDAVLASVRTWKYTPGSKKGVKVKVKMTSKQTFRAG